MTPHPASWLCFHRLFHSPHLHSLGLLLPRDVDHWNSLVLEYKDKQVVQIRIQISHVEAVSVLVGFDLIPEYIPTCRYHYILTSYQWMLSFSANRSAMVVLRFHVPVTWKVAPVTYESGTQNLIVTNQITLFYVWIKLPGFIRRVPLHHYFRMFLWISNVWHTFLLSNYCFNRPQTILGVYVNKVGKDSVAWRHALQSVGQSRIDLKYAQS